MNLASQDRWAPLLARLPVGLKKIAAAGVPAFGTRTRWTLALVKALSELVGPEQARSLMLYWLTERSHASEDITMNFDVAEQHTLRIVGDAYKSAGVPKRSWEFVSGVLDSFFYARREKNMFWPSVVEHLHHPEQITSDVRRTAFRILKRFYEQGVPTRPINWREFAEYVGKNKGRDVERLLGEGTWLKLIEPYEKKKHSRIYALVPSLWPPRPGEERLYTPG